MSVPDQSLSKPEHPDHALGQPAHHNVEPIWASYVPLLQFPYRILPGSPFLLPHEVSTPADFGTSSQIAYD